MELTDGIVDAIAAHRLTRLVTRDRVMRPVRARVIAIAYGTDEWSWPNGTVPVGELDAMSEREWDERPGNDDDAPALAEFVGCRWCTGVWISAFVVVARRYAPGAWDPLARLLAISDAAALLARLEDD